MRCGVLFVIAAAACSQSHSASDRHADASTATGGGNAGRAPGNGVDGAAGAAGGQQPDASTPAHDGGADADALAMSGDGADGGAPSGTWIWQSTAASMNDDLNGVWTSGANDAYAVGDSATMLHWNGIAWSSVPPGTKNHIQFIWGASPTNIWAGGSGLLGVGGTMVGYATMVHWDGTTWSPAPVAANAYIDGVWGTGPNDVWAVGDVWADGSRSSTGLVMHFDGAKWTQAFASTTNDYHSVWGSGPNDVWVMGDRALGSPTDQHVLHYTGTWKANPEAGSGAGNIWVSPSGHAWAVGEAGVLFWDGTAWSTLPVPKMGVPQAVTMSIWGSADDDVWLVGAGLIAHFDGNAWTETAMDGAFLRGIGGSDRDNVWAVGQSGLIMRLDRNTSGPASCEQVGATCTVASACAPGQGHLTNHACGDASQVCCTAPLACGGPGEPTCCGPSGPLIDVRPECRNNEFVCPGPVDATPCLPAS